MFPTVPRCLRRSICTSATRPSSRTATRVSRSDEETRSSFGTRGVYPRPAKAPGSDVDVSPVRDGEDQPEHAPRRDERGPAVRDERQRDAGRGEDADVHRDVHERLRRDVEDEEQDEHRPAAVARVAREREPSRDEKAIEREEDRDARKPPLLGQGRENEVRVPHGQEAEPALRAALPALAEDAPGADRDPGLPHLIAGAARREVRVEERANPILLVVLQKEPRT